MLIEEGCLSSICNEDDPEGPQRGVEWRAVSHVPD